MMVSSKMSPVLQEKTLQKLLLVNPKWAGGIHKDRGFGENREVHSVVCVCVCVCE